MAKFILPVILASISIFLTSVSADNSKRLQCHTCLGRDWDNCERGTVTCHNGTHNGVCFKVVDHKKYITAKGCDYSRTSVSDGGDTVENVVVPGVKLYWEEGSPDLQGTAYYCQTIDPTKFCNAGSLVQYSTGLLLAILLICIWAPFH